MPRNSWWRTVADDVTSSRPRQTSTGFAAHAVIPKCGPPPRVAATVATLAEAEPLHPVPAAPYPVIVAQERTASRQALVAYRGNRYSVPPELAAAQVG